MASRLQDVILRGLAGDQPLATDVAAGTLYYSTDLEITERSDGTNWESYSDAGTSSGSNTGFIFLDGNPGEDAPLIPGPAGSSGAGGGGAMTLVASQVAAGATVYDFPNLSGYSEIMVIIRLVALSSASTLIVRVSTNNGSTFLSASGDYQGITGIGSEQAETAITTSNTTASAARSGVINIFGFNVASAPKASRSTFFNADGQLLRIITTTTALNALRVTTIGGTQTMDSGNIYVFGRP